MSHTPRALAEGARFCADLLILSENPLTIDPMRINQIEVLETIREGRTVFSK